MEMPPLTLMVLDGLMTDIETVETLRDHGEAKPYGLSLVDENEIVDAIRELLHDGLVEAVNWRDGQYAVIRGAGNHDATSLRRHWYRPTAAGRRAWTEGEELLDAYWDAHPITFSTAVRLKGVWRAIRWRMPF
jgi:hypothetical protein